MKPTIGFSCWPCTSGRRRLVGTADFADHDDGIGVRVIVGTCLHHIDVLQPLIGSPPMPPTALDWPAGSR